MVDNFLAGSAALFGDPFTIGIFIFGVIGGMLFGAIPGVSMLTLAAILLPFTASLEPAQGVMLFAVIYCTGTYGGAITAILFNIPGAPENAPTAFDGYPMSSWSSSFVFCNRWCLICVDNDGGNRTSGELGNLQYRASRNICIGIFRPCCCFLSRWKDHVEGLDVCVTRFTNCYDWPGSGWRYKSIQFRYF